MVMSSRLTLSCAALAAALALGFAASAVAALPMAKPMHKGDMTYVSGGIGRAEQRAIERDAAGYNLRVTNANKAGDFTVGTKMVIKGQRRTLSVTDTGPLFYAKLPPGRYTIRAINEGQTEMRRVTIPARGAAAVHLIWSQPG
jgi:hypothetical protein